MGLAFPAPSPSLAAAASVYALAMSLAALPTLGGALGLWGGVEEACTERV